jgi:hypothetical protein
MPAPKDSDEAETEIGESCGAPVPTVRTCG